ncbi:alpha/beta fold hydrolase [Acetobacteroides hydrogenigenes]|uniref:Pimeloyl-ACP methyl ester carboxylesterase n=1 Tax=Acetobacteroides hydrogenigenes TaxID=979970 RepID=A0A4R2EWA9_9BACT|nr:alpha/beta fold hydrolase [Acetobacteroides hydrogenigenes]TCN72948.1 pimeloyl-ACP methyl ester carboxylesterase [Acetobacteroides hydrogenigenes]
MKLFYRHFGNGWPLIIVHGLYGSSDNWLSVAKRLETHFSIYLIDLRNHGHSPHSSIHSYEAMALDLSEFIEDKHIEKPILIGHSMGGKVVMQYGLMFPNRVQRVVVVDISPLSNSHNQHKQHIIEEHKSIISTLKGLPIESVNSYVEADIMLKKHIDSERLRGFLLKNLGRQGKGFRWKFNLTVIAEQLESIMQGFEINNPKHVNQNSFPILFIKGKESDYIDDDDIKAIHQFYPEFKMVGIDNAGHWVHAEQQDRFINELIQFCSIEAHLS